MLLTQGSLQRTASLLCLSPQRRCSPQSTPTPGHVQVTKICVIKKRGSMWVKHLPRTTEGRVGGCCLWCTLSAHFHHSTWAGLWAVLWRSEKAKRKIKIQPMTTTNIYKWFSLVCVSSHGVPSLVLIHVNTPDISLMNSISCTEHLWVSGKKNTVSEIELAQIFFSFLSTFMVLKKCIVEWNVSNTFYSYTRF